MASGALALQHLSRLACRMPRSFARILLSFVLLPPAIVLAASPIQERADHFLKLANAGYQALYRVNSEAQWAAVTDVSPVHDAASAVAAIFLQGVAVPPDV